VSRQSLLPYGMVKRIREAAGVGDSELRENVKLLVEMLAEDEEFR
jgi:hypothetical protein